MGLKICNTVNYSDFLTFIAKLCLIVPPFNDQLNSCGT